MVSCDLYTIIQANSFQIEELDSIYDLDVTYNSLKIA